MTYIYLSYTKYKRYTTDGVHPLDKTCPKDEDILQCPVLAGGLSVVELGIGAPAAWTRPIGTHTGHGYLCPVHAQRIHVSPTQTYLVQKSYT